MDTGSGLKEVACALSGATVVTRKVASLSGANWSLTPSFNSGTTQVTCTALDNFDKPTEVSLTVIIAIPKPTFESISVKDGMVTNLDQFRVDYLVRVGTSTFPEFTTVNLVEGVNHIFLQSKAKNVAGEIGELAITYYLKKNVVFVDQNATKDNDGSSWANAYVKWEDALASKKVREGGTGIQIWMSKGNYRYPNGSGFLDVALPKSGHIMGGFDAAQLPSDSSLAKRDLVANRTVVWDYNMKLDTLDTRLEMSGLEFAGTRFHASIDTFSPAYGSTMDFVYCKMLGTLAGSGAASNWNFSSSGNPELEMIHCDVTNNVLIPPSNTLADNWELDYYSNGRFLARNTTFTRASEGGWIMYTTSGNTEFRFENCALNYFTTGGAYQISFRNPASALYIINSTILGGLGTIGTAGGTINQ